MREFPWKSEHAPLDSDPRLQTLPRAKRTAKAGCGKELRRSRRRRWKLEGAKEDSAVGRKEVQQAMERHQYVCTVESVFHPGQVCSSRTHDLRQRLKEHNAGKVPYTSMTKRRSARGSRSQLGV